MATMLITGASRGLGNLLQLELPKKNDTIYLVSRSKPQMAKDGVERHWIQADLSKTGVAKNISGKVSQALDLLIYNAGIWEENAFSDAYRFEEVSEEETRSIIDVNLTSAILLVKALLPRLKQSKNPKIILIGSVSGKAYSRGQEVAYVASKAGLLGVASSLREYLRKEKIAVTVVNPGNFGVFDGLQNSSGIPAKDLLELIGYIANTSNLSCVREIDIVAMDDPF